MLRCHIAAEICIIFILQLPCFICITCLNLYNPNNAPCLEVPPCYGDEGATVTSTISLLSNGHGSAQSYSTIALCFTKTELQIRHVAMKQSFVSNSPYSLCNDPIFYSNVAELFIAPDVEDVPHCYNELDISPYDVMYLSGIYNPNLNHTGVVGSTFPCESSGINHVTTIDAKSSQWSSDLSIPFSLLNCPYHCPLERYSSHALQCGRVDD